MVGAGPGTFRDSRRTSDLMKSLCPALVSLLLLGCAQSNKEGTAWEGLTEPPTDTTGDGSPEESSETTGGSDGPGSPTTGSPTTGSATTPGEETSATSGSGETGGDETGGEGESTGAGRPLPDPGPQIGSFQLTYYWVSEEADHPSGGNETLYDPDCNALATVSADFADALTLEGTGRLSDGRVLNYWNSCGCPNSPCFFEVDEDHPWGFGVQNRALQPFRSLAVDTDVLDIGDWVYVAEFDGLMMPGEAPWGAFVHDGCVIADDIGGGINGQHIDFFAGLRAFYTDLDGTLGLTQVTLHAPGDRCGD